MDKLHYIYDPLCGWCYAAAPLLDALTEAFPEVPVELHGGGLFSRQPISAELARYIRGHDARIAALSGQPFGDDYLNGLLEDRNAILDSEPVIAGILAVAQLDAGMAVAMLKRIQSAHYQEGLKVVEEQVLQDLAAQVVPRVADDFAGVYRHCRETGVQEHIRRTRQLMHRLGVGGFPVFVTERDGELTVIDHMRNYGDPAGFIAALQGHDGKENHNAGLA